MNTGLVDWVAPLPRRPAGNLAIVPMAAVEARRRRIQPKRFLDDHPKQREPVRKPGVDARSQRLGSLRRGLLLQLLHAVAQHVCTGPHDAMIDQAANGSDVR